jgi:hypothetical protein
VIFQAKCTRCLKNVITARQGDLDKWLEQHLRTQPGHRILVSSESGPEDISEQLPALEKRVNGLSSDMWDAVQGLNARISKLEQS